MMELIKKPLLTVATFDNNYLKLIVHVDKRQGLVNFEIDDGDHNLDFSITLDTIKEISTDD